MIFATQQSRGARSIRIAMLPAEFKETGGADVRDVLNGPGGREAVLQAIADAAIWAPPSATKAEEADGDELSIATPRGRTDLANAKRFIAFAGEDIRHVGPWKKYLAYLGTHWAIDQSFAADRMAKLSVSLLWKQVADLAPRASESEVATFVQYARSSSSASSIKNILNLARSEAGIAVMPAALDRNEWLFNVANGTIDLRTGELRPHSRADMITKLCPIHYDPAAACPLWESCVSLWMNHDADMVRYLQRWAGYGLTGSVCEQALPVAYGLGSNGKSLWLNTLLGVMGPCYAIKCPSDFLMVRQGEGHPTERADLSGVRFACCNEVDDGKRLSESLVKELTGSDPIRARRMREDFWEYLPTHKIWLATNHKPGVRGTDHGIWRRLKLVEFGVKIEGAQKDNRLDVKLQAEFPGILAWAVRGCLEWQRIGLAHPPKVEMATLAYRGEMDVVGTFLAEMCIDGRKGAPGLKVKARNLYSAYRRWCKSTGEHEVNQRRFGQVLTERGFERYSNNGTMYRDLALLSRHDDQDEDGQDGESDESF